MSPRERRLKADFDKIVDEFSNHKYISVDYDKELIGVPERYYVNYSNVISLKLSSESTKENKTFELISKHKVEIYLHIDYPRLKPLCYLRTEIFHPNFRMAPPHDICIGDYWAPGESLVDVIYQIGEMIQYKNYNISNPLNGVASKWAKGNRHLFPIDNKDLRQVFSDAESSEKKIDITFHDSKK